MSGRIPELDGVRGLAILLVISLHYISEIAEVRWGFLFRLAWSGVDLFFVLSGFLIGGILLDAKHSSKYYQTFYARRFFRIVPVYSLMLVGLVIGMNAGSPNGPLWFTRIFYSKLPLWTYVLFVQNLAMTFVQSWGCLWMSPTWSLAVEEQFYLILPFCVRRLNVTAIWRLAIGMIVAAPILRVALKLAGLDSMACYVLLPCRADALSYGVLIALACRDQKRWEWLVANRRYLVSVFLVLGAGVVVWTFRDFPMMEWVGYAWMGAFYAALLTLLVVHPDGIPRMIFRNGLLVKVGTISYGLYLFHAGMLGVVHYVVLSGPPTIHDFRTLSVTVLALAVVFLLCGASWRFLEKPLIERARRKYRYGA